MLCICLLFAAGVIPGSFALQGVGSPDGLLAKSQQASGQGRMTTSESHAVRVANRRLLQTQPSTTQQDNLDIPGQEYTGHDYPTPIDQALLPPAHPSPMPPSPLLQPPPPPPPAGNQEAGRKRPPPAQPPSLPPEPRLPHWPEWPTMPPHPPPPGLPPPEPLTPRAPYAPVPYWPQWPTEPPHPPPPGLPPPEPLAPQAPPPLSPSSPPPSYPPAPNVPLPPAYPSRPPPPSYPVWTEPQFPAIPPPLSLPSPTPLPPPLVYPSPPPLEPSKPSFLLAPAPPPLSRPPSKFQPPPISPAASPPPRSTPPAPPHAPPPPPPHSRPPLVRSPAPPSTQPPPPTPITTNAIAAQSTPASPLGIIIGAVVGGVGGVAALACLIWWIRAHSNAKRPDQHTPDKASLYDTTTTGRPATVPLEQTAQALGWNKLEQKAGLLVNTGATRTGMTTGDGSVFIGINATDTRGVDTESTHTAGQKPRPESPTAGQPDTSVTAADQSLDVLPSLPQGQSSHPARTGGSLDRTFAFQEHVLLTLHIPWSDLSISKVLGEGGFGKVFKGRWQGSVDVAVKMLNTERMTSGARDALRQEALVMCELRHPYIAPVYGLVDDGTHHALVMKYYKRGTVASAIARDDYSDLELTVKLKMALQVASGMSRLHERQPAPVLHGDLKTSNLLVDDDGKSVVIADFGLAKVLRAGQVGQVVESGALTVSISPPEVLANPKAPRTRAGDVYAFGIVLLELVAGRPAYRHMRATQVIDAVRGGSRPTIPDCVPDDVRALIAACWSQEAADRPTFTEVVKRLVGAVETHGGVDCTTTMTGTFALS